MPKYETPIVKCPKCGENLQSLTQVLDLREINNVWLEKGDLQVDNIDYVDIPNHDFEVYSCPFCDAEIAKTQEEAISFLTGKKENPGKKNPNNPHPKVGLPSMFNGGE